MVSKNPRLIDRLRRASSPKLRRAIRRDGNERAPLIVRLDHRWQKLSRSRAAGRDHRARLSSFHGPPEREKTRAPLLKVPPNAHQARQLRAGQRFQQRRIPRARTDDELAHPRVKTIPDHFQSRVPCIHGRCRNSTDLESPSTRFSDCPGRALMGEFLTRWLPGKSLENRLLYGSIG
jgi:hypothetical protein